MCFDSNPYSSSIREMLTTFGTATYKVGLKVHPNEQDPRMPIMCWGSCSYTIQSIGQYAGCRQRIQISPACAMIGSCIFCLLEKNNVMFTMFSALFCTERLLVDEEKPLFGSLPCRQVWKPNSSC